jgi:5'-3' exonuclease
MSSPTGAPSRPPLKVFLVDGTYELFRHFFGAPPHVNSSGAEVGAARAVVSSMLGLIDETTASTGGPAHIGVATDHVIESFRNGMWPGYKTGAGVDPILMGQFGLLEEGLAAAGIVVWPMVDLEADDALASAAAMADADPAVEQVAICTPDKDLGQCVKGGRVVQIDRRKRAVIDEDGVRAKFGVSPESIPDWLALVGDSADGFPGLPGFGAKTAAAVLSRYGHLEEIPDAPGQWDVAVRGAAALASTLAGSRDLAMLFRDLATLRTEPPVVSSVAELRWPGPTPEFVTLCERVFEQPALLRRAEQLTSRS